MLWWTLRKLRSPDASVRRQAAEKLGRSKRARVLQPLVLAALVDPSDYVRDGARRSLADLGNADAAGLVVAIAAHTPMDAAMRDRVLSSAPEVLRELDDPQGVVAVISALLQPDAEVRGRAGLLWSRLVAQDRAWVQAVARQGVEALAAVLAGQGAVEVRQAAAEVLGRIEDPGVRAPLAQALADPVEAVREAALVALTPWLVPDDLPALLHLLAHDPSARVRHLVAGHALLRDVRAVPALAERLGDAVPVERAYRTSSVGRAALDTLAEIPGAEATEALVQGFRRLEPAVALEVLDRLRARGWQPSSAGDRARRAEVEVGVRGPLLVRFASEVGPGSLAVTAAVGAAQALGELGDERAVEALRGLLRVATPEARQAAAAALLEIGGARAVPWLTGGTGPVCDEAIVALETLGRPVIPALVEVLDRNGYRAVAALERLGWKPSDDVERARLLVARGAYAEAEQLGAVAAGPLLRAVVARADSTGLSAQGEAMLARVDYVPGDVLRRLVERSVRSIDADTLRGMAALEDFVISFTAHGNCNYSTGASQQIDFGPLRQLARQELARREREPGKR